MDPTYPLNPIIQFICFFLVILPLASGLLKPWNTGICMYAIWVALSSLIRGTNAIIWSNNFNIVTPVWCDITTHFDAAGSIGIPACSLTITRRLYLLTRLREPVRSKHEKQKEVLFDMFLCLGLPLIISALSYIVESNRFAVFEEFGCESFLVPSVLTLLITASGSVILPLISVLFYCPRIVWVYYHHRKEVNEFLTSSGSVNQSNYYRILALGLLDVLLTLPISILGITVDAIQEPLSFWPGWKIAHADWPEIAQVPSSLWQSSFWVNFTIRWDEWINTAFALIFFLLFGFTKEARAGYRRAFSSIGRLFGVAPSSQPSAARVVEGNVSDMVFHSVAINTSSNRSANSISMSSEDSNLECTERSDLRLDEVLNKSSKSTVDLEKALDKEFV